MGTRERSLNDYMNRGFKMIHSLTIKQFAAFLEALTLGISLDDLLPGLGMDFERAAKIKQHIEAHGFQAFNEVQH